VLLLFTTLFVALLLAGLSWSAWQHWQRLRRTVAVQGATLVTLEQTAAQYRTLVEQIPAVVYIESLRDGGAGTYMSPRVVELLGYAAAEFQGDPTRWLALLHPEDRERVAAELRRTDATGDPFRMDYRLLAKDGRVVWVRAEALLIRDAAGQPLRWQGLWTDITQQKALEAELAYRATHDRLTHLPNRALFLERLTQALGRRQADEPVQLLYIDLDGFKTINDTLGHGAGDEVLLVVAERLLAGVRSGDTVARLGGDEFTVLLAHGASDQELRHLVDRLTERLQQPLVIGGHDVTLTASIGVATSSDPADRPEDVLHQADLAMYHLKQGCKGHLRVLRSADQPRQPDSSARA
jgi:diguanylate cyclase (GGDEF)-like protein/PAS domain S-box-containing protein